MFRFKAFLELRLDRSRVFFCLVFLLWLALPIGKSAYAAGCHDSIDISQNLYLPKAGLLSIQSNLCVDGPYQLGIYNTVGEQVRELRNVKKQLAGTDLVTWDGKNESGDPVASGVYIIFMRTDSGTFKNRVAVVR